MPRDGRRLLSAFPRLSALSLLYVATALMVLALTAQRSFYPHDHWTFWIFRASFWHLFRQQNLYARYRHHDLFKYSPTAALLFAPIAFPPYPLALLLWNAANAVALIVALNCMAKRQDRVLVLLLIIPELFVTTQASQCNALVAALIIFAFIALERGKQVRALGAIAIGFAMKLFPIAALSLAIFYPRWRRAAVIFAGWVLALLLLPLLVTTPSMLIAQYEWWRTVEGSDAMLLGSSVMRVIHQLLGVQWPNWPVQLAGVAGLLLPLVHRDRWSDARFRRAFLASLLVFVVIFNHQAERPSYIIAAAGVAIWYLDSAREPLRLVVVLISLAGLRAWAYFPLWLLMQAELHGATVPWAGRLHGPVFPTRDASMAASETGDARLPASH